MEIPIESKFPADREFGRQSPELVLYESLAEAASFDSLGGEAKEDDSPMSRRNLCQPSFVDAMVSGWGKSGGFLDRIEQAFDWAAFEALAFADPHLRRGAPGLSASGSVQDPSLQPCHTLSDPGAEEAIRGPVVVSPCLMACPLRPRRRTTLRSGAFWPDNRKARPFGGAACGEEP
jgi:hypothetical protein